MDQQVNFGTDGIRGTANQWPMLPELAVKIAQAAGLAFRERYGEHHRLRALIGKDTRLSCYMLEQALTSGFLSAGLDVILVGPCPTPAVAMLTRSVRADLGVMISASHNPYEDNGIKLFGPDGFKLDDALQSRIEALLREDLALRMAGASDLGQAWRMEDALGRYIEFVKSGFPRGQTLEGMKIVVDCAHGAAYKAGPSVLRELAADVIALGVQPNGRNINDGCGSTAPEAMQKAVVENGADLGLAFDGDADRVVMADETGALVDGDQILACIARHWQQEGKLQGGQVVSTVMANAGMAAYLAGHDIELLRTPVGDRHVIQKMREENLNVGGEPSGHLILGEHATTGDGLAAALEVLAVLCSGHWDRASAALHPYAPFPQLLRNVRIDGAARDILDRTEIARALAQAEASLAAEQGRLVVRPSGTEPLIRVMAEAREAGLVEETVQRLCAEIERCAG